MRFQSRAKALPMAVQAGALRKHCDTISLRIRGSSSLKWRGRILPAEYTDHYVIEVDYRTDTSFLPRPHVFVRDPLLKLRDGRGCPHRHGNDEPCLYYHHGTEWNTGMLLAETIVPWNFTVALFLRTLARNRRVEGRRHSARPGNTNTSPPPPTTPPTPPSE